MDSAIATIIGSHRHLDVVIHNAGHMVFGPLEAFTPEQLAELYDVNVLSTQRVNRAALPHLRAQKKGLNLLQGLERVRQSSSLMAGRFAPMPRMLRCSFSDKA